jgi:hypothetical protein
MTAISAFINPGIQLCSLAIHVKRRPRPPPKKKRSLDRVLCVIPQNQSHVEKVCLYKSALLPEYKT